MSSGQDDDVVGKAYDARLMRRLLEYLRPYWRQVVLAFVTIIVSTVSSLVQPYLIKIAIDRYIAQRRLAGLDGLAVLYLTVLVASLCRRVLPDLDAADDRAADHVRPADGASTATCSGWISATTTATRSAA
jgi:hypothetical protein